MALPLTTVLVRASPLTMARIDALLSRYQAVGLIPCCAAHPQIWAAGYLLDLAATSGLLPADPGAIQFFAGDCADYQQVSIITTERAAEIITETALRADASPQAVASLALGLAAHIEAARWAH